jgi:hypothetical protein
MSKWHAYNNLSMDHIEAAGSRKNVTKTRGRPFVKGNPGRPKGARGRATLAAQMLLNGEAEALTRKAIELALDGDTMALRLCLERILPPRKELPIEFTMPPLRLSADLAAAMAAVIQAVAEGRILLAQALDFARLLHLYSQTASASDPDDLSALTDEELEDRISRLEALAAIDIDWHAEGEAAAGPQAS